MARLFVREGRGEVGEGCEESGWGEDNNKTNERKTSDGADTAVAAASAPAAAIKSNLAHGDRPRYDSSFSTPLSFGLFCCASEMTPSTLPSFASRMRNVYNTTRHDTTRW